MKLAGAIIVEYLSKDTGMPVEKVLVEHRVVIGERFRKPRQARGGDLFQRGPVRFKAEPAHVQDDPVLAVHLSLFPFNEPLPSSPVFRPFDSPRIRGIPLIEQPLLETYW